MGILGTCWTKKGCAAQRKRKQTRLENKFKIKTAKIDVDSILANKGIDSRNNRISSVWGGIGNVTQTVGNSAVGIFGNGKSISTNRIGSGTINSSKTDMVIDAMTTPDNQPIFKYGLLGLAAIIIYKILK